MRKSQNEKRRVFWPPNFSLMSIYSNLSPISNREFRRYTGVTRFVFDICVLILNEYYAQTKIKKGRPNKLMTEDQLLMFFEYYRENRTFFHLSKSYGLCESNAHRSIVKTESILIQSGYFRLEGKKALLTNKKIKTILVDVTETPALRPKKKT